MVRGLLLGSALLSAGASAASELSGDVVDSHGQPLSGAMVTVTNRGVTTTRYTDAAGTFRFAGLPDADLSVRARRVGYTDQSASVRGGGEALIFKMPDASRDEVLLTLPSSAWTERVEIEDPVHYQRFRIHCMGCHQLGALPTRWPQTREQWDGVFNRMAHKSALLTPESRDVIAEALIKAFTVEEGETPRLPDPPAGQALLATITEWRMPSSDVWPHDAKLGPDGIVYITDSTLGRLLRLDPKTNDMQAFELEEYDPEYRNFVGTSTKTYPHGLGVGPDGNVWVLLGLDQSVAKFDTVEQKFTARYRLPRGAVFPHTARFDSNGGLWFSLALSNQIGVLDIATGDIRIIDLPTRGPSQWITARLAPVVLWLVTKFRFETTNDPELMPMPYGIDIAPDGKVWVSQWNNQAIVSYDPATDALKSYDTPFYGPRRLAVDSRGNVWIPAWGEGRIYRFQPQTEGFTGYDLPPGRGSAAYTIDVHPQDDSIWICGANSDTMMRFDADSEAFDVYPMPTRVTFCRDIDFDSQGNVWTNYSNLPTQHIEGGGLAAIVRIEPGSRELVRAP